MSSSIAGAIGELFREPICLVLKPCSSQRCGERDRRYPNEHGEVDKQAGPFGSDVGIGSGDNARCKNRRQRSDCHRGWRQHESGKRDRDHEQAPKWAAETAVERCDRRDDYARRDGPREGNAYSPGSCCLDGYEDEETDHPEREARRRDDPNAKTMAAMWCRCEIPHLPAGSGKVMSELSISRAESDRGGPFSLLNVDRARTVIMSLPKGCWHHPRRRESVAEKEARWESSAGRCALGGEA